MIKTNNKKTKFNRSTDQTHSLTRNHNIKPVQTFMRQPQIFSAYIPHNSFTSVSLFQSSGAVKPEQLCDINPSFHSYLHLCFSTFVSVSAVKNAFLARTMKKCCPALRANNAYLSFITYSKKFVQLFSV